MRIPVFVERWQHECCGAEFGVGDEVTWQLAVDAGRRREQLGAHAPGRAIELSVDDVVHADGTQRAGALLSGAGVHAFLASRADPPPAGGSRTVVLFEEDHHGYVPADLPPTVGVVATIHLARVRYVEIGGGEQRPVLGTARLDALQRADRWQVDLVDGRRFTGFLVALRVST